jgi:hypothetical protein
MHPFPHYALKAKAETEMKDDSVPKKTMCWENKKNSWGKLVDGNIP